MAKRNTRRPGKRAAAPTQAVKGIGRMGQVENILNPTTVDPGKSPRGSALTAALLGPQGRRG